MLKWLAIVKRPRVVVIIAIVILALLGGERGRELAAEFLGLGPKPSASSSSSPQPLDLVPSR